MTDLEHIKPILERMLSALESVDSRMGKLEGKTNIILERLERVELHYNGHGVEPPNGTDARDTE